MSDESIGGELVEVFTAEALADLQTLASALSPADGSWPAPQLLQDHYILAHKLNGASMNYGYERLAQCGDMMERLLEHATKISPSQWPDAVLFLREMVENCRIRVGRIGNEGMDDDHLTDGWAIRLSALIAERLVNTPPSAVMPDGSVTAEYCMPAIDTEILEFFIPEIEGYIGTVRGLVASLREHPGDVEQLDALFRTVHTIKGSAYTVGFEVIGDLAAPLEDCLGSIHDSKLSASPQLLDTTELTMEVIQSLLRRNPGDLISLQRDIPLVIDALRRMQPCQRIDAEETARADEPSRVVVAEWSAEEVQALPLTAEYLVPEVDAGDFSYFLSEAVGYLQVMENLLLTLENNPSDEETIHQLFGNVHTLKGSAYTINFQVIGDLAHIIEDYLDAVRRKRLNITAVFTDIMLQTVDVLRLLLQRDSTQVPRLEERVAKARAMLATLGKPAVSAVASLPPVAQVSEHVPGSVAASLPDSGSGEGGAVSTEVGIGATDHQQIRVRRDRLEQLLNFVGELIIARGRLERRLDALSALTSQVQACKNRLLNSIQTFEQKHTFTMPSVSPQPIAGRTANMQSGIAEFGELEFDKYDDFNILARRIGEGAADISESIAQLNTSLTIAREEMNALQELTTGIRDQTVRARMVSIGGLFSRFRRSVRESARSTGKDVQLVMTGERTEIDTGVMERLIDPLIHLMRNAVFHGIESAEVRVANGKPATGTIRLSAAQRGNSVLIEVEDDGRGLDLEAIKEKAIERGLVGDDMASQLTNAEIVRFIFLSGFSTAKTSTDQAGRGVGMDVVERVIRSMNGRIEVDTVKGRGTRFSLCLPLTLLITMGLIVSVGEMQLAIPLANIREITLPMTHPVIKIGSQTIMEVNDEVIEVHALSDLLGYMAPAIENSTPIVIVHTDAGPKGLAVTKLLGQQEIVVKPFASPKLMDKVVFSGATFDLDGKVILVLDVNRVFTRSGAGAPMRSLQPAGSVDESEVGGVAEAPAAEQVKMLYVLLIDDSLSIRKFVGRMLETAGYQVATAGNGEEGVRMASTQSYHLIITDLEMPKLNGYEVIQALRARPQTESVPILVMTTRAGEKHRKLALEVGATGYITKPVDERTLLIEVERVTGGVAQPLR